MTEERKKQIVDLYLELGTYAKVKNALGVSWDNICQAIKEAGINKGSGGNHPNMIHDDVFIKYARAGKTVKEIAEILNVYNSTVSNRLRKLGIEPIFEDKAAKYQDAARKVDLWSGGTLELLSIEKTQCGDKKATVRCKNCGEVFTRTPITAIRDRSTRCPGCYAPKNEIYLRKLSRSEHNITELEKEKNCVICGATFHNSDERRKTCSAICADLLRKTNSGLKRFRHKGGMVIDYGITLRRLYDRDGGRCWICGRQTDFADVKFTEDGQKYCGDTHPVKDHLVPLAHGGDESWENVRLACWRCNINKSDSVVDVEETKKSKRLVVSERCGKKDGAIPVSQFTVDGNLIKTYRSVMQASRETGIPHCQISAARTGRQQTAHGYVWRTCKEAEQYAEV